MSGETSAQTAWSPEGGMEGGGPGAGPAGEEEELASIGSGRMRQQKMEGPNRGVRPGGIFAPPRPRPAEG